MTLVNEKKIMTAYYAGSDVERLATGGDPNAAATPVFFSVLLRKPGPKG